MTIWEPKTRVFPCTLVDMHFPINGTGYYNSANNGVALQFQLSRLSNFESCVANSKNATQENFHWQLRESWFLSQNTAWKSCSIEVASGNFSEPVSTMQQRVDLTDSTRLLETHPIRRVFINMHTCMAIRFRVLILPENSWAQQVRSFSLTTYSYFPKDWLPSLA